MIYIHIFMNKIIHLNFISDKQLQSFKVCLSLFSVWKTYPHTTSQLSCYRQNKIILHVFSAIQTEDMVHSRK